MNREKVSSSNIRSIGYDKHSQVLEVEFNTGGVYQYSGVPEETYSALMRAESHGRYFHAQIKNAYPCLRIS